MPKVLLLDVPLQAREPRSAGGLVGGEEVTVAGVRPDGGPAGQRQPG
jgi:hypothetical protein